MQHYFSVNKLWIKPLRWNEGLDHLIWAVKWEVWFKSGQNTNLKGISFCFGYNHSFSKPLCTTQKLLVLSLLRTLYTQGHTLINNNSNVKTFMKATGSPFHFKRQNKVCFLCCMAPSDYKAASFLWLWYSSIHLQHSAIRNSFSIIPSIPDNSESNLVTGTESNYINYTEIAHLIGNGLVCWQDLGHIAGSIFDCDCFITS